MTDTNHRTRWTVEEVDFLEQNWDGKRGTTEVIAELLGRTVDACQQRHYEEQWKVAAAPLQEKPLLDPRRTHRAATAYRQASLLQTLLETEVCQRCFTAKAVNGECLCG